MEEGGVDRPADAAYLVNNVVSGESTLVFDVTLKTSYPVEAVLVPSHPEANVRRAADGGWRVSLSSGGPALLQRDFVLNYRLADRPAHVELIPFKEKGAAEGSFMVVVTPGDDLKRVAEGADWTFVLDVSGSMQTKLATLMEGVDKSLGEMRRGDRFRILAFNNSHYWVVEPFIEATPENVADAIYRVRRLRSEGGTDLFSALERAVTGLDPERTSAILLVTDGVANAGVIEHRRFVELARAADVRLFTFVMGNSADTPLLEDLAEASNGFSASLSNDDALIGRLLQARSKLTHEAMHDVRLAVHGPKVFDLTPSKPLTLYRGDQLVLFGKYRGSGEGRLEFSAKISGAPFKATIQTTLPDSDTRNPEIERLWALARIEELEQAKRLGGDAGELDAAIRDLGARYSLVTGQTSMVVISDESFAGRKVERRNLGRVARERAAQLARASEPAPAYTPSYSPQPVSSSRAPRLGGGGGGGGAVGPWFGLLSAALAFGLPALRRRRK